MQSVTPKNYILYAEDTLHDLEWLRGKLNMIPCNVELVRVDNGLELIQFLSALKSNDPHPSCILLDINMPVWDGIRTLTVLKKEPSWKNIPVAMLAEPGQTKDADLSLKLGAERVIYKPIQASDLVLLSENIFPHFTRQPSGEGIVA